MPARRSEWERRVTHATDDTTGDAWKRDRIGAAERGENPLVIARMPSGFAVIGDTQFLPGYCVLLAAPQVAHLSDLPLAARRRYLLDMALLGEAVERACRDDGLRRINYEILGNTDTFVHAHVFPRYEWEPADLLPGPVWGYPRDRWTSPEYAYAEERHGALRGRIAAELSALLVAASGL